MSDNPIAKRQMGFEPANLSEAADLAKRLSGTGIVPDALRGKPDDILATLLVGHELGLKPMQALRSIHIVKGRPVMSADLMVALCLANPICAEFTVLHSDDKVAHYRASRMGRAPSELKWTIDMAKRAGLLDKNPTWKAHPEAMLRARCASALARAVFPDLLLGVYEESEGEEIAARPVEVKVADVVPTAQVKVLPPEPEQKALPAPSATAEASEAPQTTSEAMAQSSVLATLEGRIKGAQSVADLDKVLPDLQKLAPADREKLRPVYGKRKSELAPKAVEAPKPVRQPGEEG